MFKFTKEDWRGGINATINMYIFFALVEWGLSYMRAEPYSVYRVLLYSFLAHCVAFVLSFLHKNKDQEELK